MYAILKIDIINAIVNGATAVDDIKKQTGATLGSGCCTQQVEQLIELLCSPRKGELIPLLVQRSSKPV